jgi:hypothetical protein
VTLYVKGQMRQAIRDALDNAYAEKLELSGHLTVCYVGDGQPVGGLSNGPKLYQAEYKLPAPASGAWGEQRSLDEPPL